MLIVDRIENEAVVVENDDTHFTIKLIEILGEVREGDVLIKCGNVYSVDKEATQRRRQQISEIQKSLWD